MIRLRFEKAEQIFENNAGQIILPIDEISPKIANKYDTKLIAEIPSLIWADDEESIKRKLFDLKAMGVYDCLAENVGAVQLAKECGMNIHGGMTLNVLNSVSLNEYADMGLVDMTMSIELAFAKYKNLKGNIPFGIIGYGYMPVMKLRSCPARGINGCGDCDGRPVLTDRIDENFQLICRGKKYSELLNCVPIYVGDKRIPNVAFQTLYFTTESKDEAETIYEMYKARLTPEFRRTAGLYFRDLQ